MGAIIGAAGGVIIAGGVLGGVLAGAALPAVLVPGVRTVAVLAGALLPAAAATRPAVLAEESEAAGVSLAQPMAARVIVSTNSDQPNGCSPIKSAASRSVLAE